VRSIAILAALGTGGCGGGCDPTGVSDRCTDPAPASLTSLEIGQGQGAQFRTLADGDTVPRVWGGQGLPMVVIHLRMTGQVPGCIDQDTTLLDGDGNTLDTEPGAMSTYDTGDGARTTGQMFLILDYDTADGEVVVIRSQAGGLTAERSLHLETVGPDAMPDGGPQPDGGDGGAGDAMAGDAAPVDAMAGDAAPADGGDGDAMTGDAAVDGG
jgi:hypothetical protein